MSQSSYRLLPILSVNFIGSLGYSIILPFLVFLVQDFGGNEVIYGLIGATYSFFQLIGSPILGRWSDRIGRRKVLLVSQAGTLSAWLLFIWALLIPVDVLTTINNEFFGSFTLSLPLLILFMARVLDGLTGGNISVANAYLADITEEKDRKKNFGRMSASANLGFIIGPALAGLLSASVYGEILPVSAAALISLIAIFLILRLPKTNERSEQRKDDSIRKLLGQEHCDDTVDAKRGSWSNLLRMKHVPYMLLLYFVLFLGFNLFYTAFPVHVATALEWDSLQLGVFFSVLSGMMILVQGPLLNLINDRFSDAFLATWGCLLLSFNFLFLLSSASILMYVAAFFFALGNGLMWPSFQSIFSKLGGQELQGAFQGIGGSVGSLASIIGLIAGGLLYRTIGQWTFFISFLIIFLTFLAAFGLKKVSRYYSKDHDEG